MRLIPTTIQLHISFIGLLFALAVTLLPPLDNGEIASPRRAFLFADQGYFVDGSQLTAEIFVIFLVTAILVLLAHPHFFRNTNNIERETARNEN